MRRIVTLANQNPHRAVAVLALLCVFSTIPLTGVIVFETLSVHGTQSRAAAPTIDISAQAIQKVHTSAVPHTDINGNFKTDFDSSSFFPIGIYNPTLCQVTKTLSWAAGPQTAGWNGEYRIKVNYGNSRNVGSYLLADINIGSALSGTVGNLPPASSLYYSIWENGTSVVVSEGSFTSDACANPADDNNFQSIKSAGFNLAILEKNVYPDNNVLSKAQASGLRLLLDLRDRPSNVFASLVNNPNVFGFYVGDDDLARARAANAPEATVGTIYNDLKGFSDSLDSQTGKIVLAAEPDINPNDSTIDPRWISWYKSFDQIGNVSFHYNYPKSSSPLFPWKSIIDVVNTVKDQVANNLDARPSWFIAQAINLKWVVPLEFPTAKENKAMVYAALIHGATGIFQFSYDGWFRRQPKGNPTGAQQNDINWWDRHAGIKANTPLLYPGGDKWAYQTTTTEAGQSMDLWNGLDASQNGLNKELDSLKGMILSKTAADDYKVYVDNNSISQAPIRTMLKQFNGDYYLMAVNIDNTTVNAKFSMTGKNFVSADVYDENRSLSLSSGTDFTDVFNPFDVHIYRFSLPLPVGSFRVQYFDNPDFTNLVLENNQSVAKIPAGGIGKVPVTALNADGTFAVRFEGQFNFNGNKIRVNASPSRDNIKVFLDGSLIINGSALQNAVFTPSVGLHTLRFDYSKNQVASGYSFLANFVDAASCFDMTGDNVINSGDQAIQANHYAASGDTAWDLNGDGIVNSLDQLILARKVGTTCS